MSSAAKNARNLVANWSAHLANLVIMFFLSPFVVHQLGPVAYGTWSLLTVVTGYMGIMDLGIRASTGRHVILYLGKNEPEKVDHTIRTSLGFFTLLGGIILVIGLGLGQLFPMIFSSVPPESHGLVALLLPVLAMNVWLTAIGTVFSSVVIAHERFDIGRGIDVLVLAVRAGGTIIALSGGHGLAGLTVAVVGANLVSLVLNYAAARRIYPALKAWPLMLSPQRVRELIGYGTAAFVSAISAKIIGQTDLLLVEWTIDVKHVTIYSVGAMIVYYSGAFLAHISATFFPSLQRAAARGETGAVKWNYLRQVRLGMLFGIAVYVGFLVFSEPFIRLWMYRPSDPDKFPLWAVGQAATVMMILAGAKLLVLPAVGANGLLAAVGRVKTTAVITVIEAITNLAFSLGFALGLGWGLAGVAAGTLFARLLVRTFTLPALACQAAGMRSTTFTLRVGSPSLIAGGLFAGVCYGLRWLVPMTSWAAFAGAVGAALAAYAPVALFVLVPAEDRRRLLRKVSSWAGREGSRPGQP